MAVTAQMVKELRSRTGLPMMECKRALVSSEGDIDLAIEELRKAGAKAQAKLAGRAANEGRIRAWLADDGTAGALCALRCETEPVTKNDEFNAALDQILDKVVTEDPSDVAALEAIAIGDGTVGDVVKSLVTRIRENFTIGKFAKFQADAVKSYVHHDQKQASMVAFSGKPLSDVEDLARGLCMHIVATKPTPTAMSRDEIDETKVAKEREILIAALKNDPKNAKKPAEILERIVTGQLGKFFAEQVLLEQPYVMDSSKTIAQACKEKGVELKQFLFVSTDS